MNETISAGSVSNIIIQSSFTLADIRRTERYYKFPLFSLFFLRNEIKISISSIITIVREKEMYHSLFPFFFFSFFQQDVDVEMENNRRIRSK